MSRTRRRAERRTTELSDGQQVTMGGMVAGTKKVADAVGLVYGVRDGGRSVRHGGVRVFPQCLRSASGASSSIDAVVSLSGKIDINEDKAPTIIVDRMTEFKLDEALRGGK